MNVERLVQMANDIASFFAAEPDRAEAESGVANHLKKFWEPGMRGALIAHVRGGGAGLSELARDGVLHLANDGSVEKGPRA